MEKTVKFIATRTISKGLTLQNEGSITYNSSQFTTKKSIKEAIIKRMIEHLNGKCTASEITVQLM